MTRFDLDGMSLDELWELHKRLSKILAARILAEKQELENRLVQLNGGRDRGAVLVPLGAKAARGDRPKRKYPQVFPKYRNPSDPNETWSGRGKQPRWLVAALKAGGKVDDYRIPESDERLHARGWGRAATPCYSEALVRRQELNSLCPRLVTHKPSAVAMRSTNKIFQSRVPWGQGNLHKFEKAGKE